MYIKKIYYTLRLENLQINYITVGSRQSTLYVVFPRLCVLTIDESIFTRTNAKRKKKKDELENSDNKKIHRSFSRVSSRPSINLHCNSFARLGCVFTFMKRPAQRGRFHLGLFHYDDTMLIFVILRVPPPTLSLHRRVYTYKRFFLQYVRTLEGIRNNIMYFV